VNPVAKGNLRGVTLLPSAAVDGGPAADLEAALARYRRLGWPAPDVALVSGSGLAVDLGAPVAGPLPLRDLLPFPIHAVVGHPLTVELLAPRPDRHVLYFRGRLHGYQGYDPHQTVLPVRLARRLGAGVLLMTNAAGGVRTDLAPGDLVLVEDQLNLSGASPLRGDLPADWGPRFPDLVGAFDPALRALAREAAAGLGLSLRAGVYAGLAGPAYETPAEVRMLRTLGADVTGMSTVLEVIAARHLGMRCRVLSLVSNQAAGVAPEPLTHDEVLAAGRAAAGALVRLLGALLADPRLTAAA
jgi:purine-nucleoside phosphorylase